MVAKRERSEERVCRSTCTAKRPAPQGRKLDRWPDVDDFDSDADTDLPPTRFTEPPVARIKAEHDGYCDDTKIFARRRSNPKKKIEKKTADDDSICDVTTAAATGPAEDQLNDDVVVEILQRLPTADVLRSRAVCKAWQRMTSSAEFIAAHAQRRRLELIFQRGGRISGTLETIPLGSLDEAEHRCLRHVQYPAYTPTRYQDWSGYFLLDSCDGLLLFQRDSDRKDFAVCNPVTQQWRMVPRVPGDVVCTVPTGFYVHGPSGEHRLLLLCLSADNQGAHYVCSLEAAAQGVRRLGQGWAWPFGNTCPNLPVRYVNHDGKLHWSQHPKIHFSTDPRPTGAEGLRLTILAFDTVQETFRWIRRPPWEGDRSCLLLEMDGMLAMGDFHILHSHLVDIWVLQDYNDDESWTLRLRVHLPQELLGSWRAINTGTGVQGRSVILLGNFTTSWAALYDVAENRVLKQTHLATSIPINVFVFKDTLERHPSIFNIVTNNVSLAR